MHKGYPRYRNISPDEFDDQEGYCRTTPGGGRVIVLGNGNHDLSDSDDEEMFVDEGKDDEELEKKNAPGGKEGERTEGKKPKEATSNKATEVVVPEQGSR